MRFWNSVESKRACISVPPPGGKGTKIRTFLSGHCCATDSAGKANPVATTAATTATERACRPTHATLTVPEGTDAEKARLLLAKAEHGCLISNSLSATRELVSEVVNP